MRGRIERNESEEIGRMDEGRERMQSKEKKDRERRRKDRQKVEKG